MYLLKKWMEVNFKTSNKLFKMKKTVIISVMLMALLSCKESIVKNNSGDQKKVKDAVSNLKKETYQPGVDWNLVWSDEFEADKIDSDNWNFQEEAAGRFNDEWQRYTSSKENAYIDNNCLVIKAIDHAKTNITMAVSIVLKPLIMLSTLSFNVRSF